MISCLYGLKGGNQLFSLVSVLRDMDGGSSAVHLRLSQMKQDSRLDIALLDKLLTRCPPKPVKTMKQMVVRDHDEHDANHRQGRHVSAWRGPTKIGTR